MYRKWTQTDYQIKNYNINKKWLQHVQIFCTNRLPNQALQYKIEVATKCTEHVQKQTTKTSTTNLTNVATTFTENGHKQTTKTSVKI